MAKNDVTKGLDPDLFEGALSDDESDSEETIEETETADSKEEDDSNEEEVADDTPTEDEALVDEPSVEDNTVTPEQEAETSEEASDESKPEKKKKRRGPGRPRKGTSDDGERALDLSATYEVQRGFTAEGGKTYHPGDVIPIQCRHCALWQREWLGRKRCGPGKRLDEDTVMHPDRFSCETFFICKEYEAELGTFLDMSLPEIVTVRAMIAGIKKVLQATASLDRWVAKQEDFDGDPREIFMNAKGFVLSFNSLEQLKLAEGFIRDYANARTKLDKKHSKKAAPRPKYNAGDWVSWVDSASKETVEGIILSIGRGNIYLAGTSKPHTGQKFTYKYKEWKSKYSPEITRKSTTSE